MPLLKAQPKQPKSATIQIRVEEDVKLRLDKYAEFIDFSVAYVVTEALKKVVLAIDCAQLGVRLFTCKQLRSLFAQRLSIVKPADEPREFIPPHDRDRVGLVCSRSWF